LEFYSAEGKKTHIPLFPLMALMLKCAVFVRDSVNVGSGQGRIMSGTQSDQAVTTSHLDVSRLAQRLKSGLRIQVFVLLGLAAVLLLVGSIAAKSSLLGGLAVFVPGLIFKMVTLRKLGGDTAAFLRTVTLAEFGKLLLVGVLCGLIFVFVKPLAPGYFFLGMIVTMVVGWGTLMRAFS